MSSLRYAFHRSLSVYCTIAAFWRSSSFVMPARQSSASDCDIVSGKISSSPPLHAVQVARATSSGGVFGIRERAQVDRQVPLERGSVAQVIGERHTGVVDQDVE
jgi:hypothetical protein